MTEKTLSIGGKDVKMKSSAAIPRLYRIKFKRDVFKDLSKPAAVPGDRAVDQGS